MKKLFLFLLLLFLVSNVVYAAKIPKKYLDENYVFKDDKKLRWIEKTGNWGKPETHGRISQNPWNLSYETNIVRDGKYSLRFEMRDRDCHENDCLRGTSKGDYGRSELGFFHSLNDQYNRDHGEIWYAWSMYIPKETNHISPAYTILGQFKEMTAQVRNKKYPECEDGAASSEGGGLIEGTGDVGLRLGFQLEEKGLKLFRETCYVKNNNSRPGYSVSNTYIIPAHQLNESKNQWLDFLLHVNWSYKEDGFIHLWINEKKVFEHHGINSSVSFTHKGKKPGVAFRFGIYNGGRYEPSKPQVVYYDSFRRGLTCKKTALWQDCKNLPSLKVSLEQTEKQQEKKIETKKLKSLEGSYELQWIQIVEKENKIVRKDKIGKDIIEIKDGKIIFKSLGNFKGIRKENRTKISLYGIQDDFVIEGTLDLWSDADDTKSMTIKGSIIPDEDGKYTAVGKWCGCSKSDEFIKISLTPIEN